MRHFLLSRHPRLGYPLLLKPARHFPHDLRLSYTFRPESWATPNPTRRERLKLVRAKETALPEALSRRPRFLKISAASLERLDIETRWLQPP
jgi:hypothetical protein